MKFKEEVLKIIEDTDTLIQSTQDSMNKHVISAETVYKNLTTVKNELERITALINRNPDK